MRHRPLHGYVDRRPWLRPVVGEGVFDEISAYARQYGTGKVGLYRCATAKGWFYWYEGIYGGRPCGVFDDIHDAAEALLNVIVVYSTVGEREQREKERDVLLAAVRLSDYRFGEPVQI